MRIVSVILFSAAFGLFCNIDTSFSQASIDKDLVNNYRTVIPKIWITYLHALGEVEGKASYKYTRNGRVESSFINEIVACYPLFLDIRGERDKAIEVYSIGNNYHFKLIRNNPDDNWVIDAIYPKSNHPASSDFSFPHRFRSIEEHEKVGFNIFNTLGVGLFASDSITNLYFLFNDDNFQVNEIEVVEKEGKELLFINFDCIYADLFPETKQSPLFIKHPNWKPFRVHGEVYLGTDYFLITQGRFISQWLGEEYEVEVECKYNDANSGFIPLPTKYRSISNYRLNDSNLEGVFETEIEFNLQNTSPKDNSRFTLSAFGLPEPDFEVRRTRFQTLRYLFMGSGVVMVLLALYQIFNKKRKSQT